MAHELLHQCTARRGRVALQLRALAVGEDLCLILNGGDSPHIGALSLHAADGTRQSFTLPGHRETEIATAVAERVQAAHGGVVTVLCGIHIDAISREEIDCVYALSEELTRSLLAALTREQEKICSTCPTCCN